MMRKMRMTNKNILVTTFGRMNPPTKSHIKLCKYMMDLATIKGADVSICLSKSVDSNKNPLTYSERRDIIEYAFQNYYGIQPPLEKCDDVLDVLKTHNGEYEIIYFVCGDDRADEYKVLFDKYNNNLYSYKEIHVISLSRSDGVSSTQARNAVKNDDINQFKRIIALPEKNNISYYFNKLRWILCPYGIDLDHSQEYLDNINKI